MSDERKSSRGGTAVQTNRRQALFARFLAVLYVFASMVGALHHHAVALAAKPVAVHAAALFTQVASHPSPVGQTGLHVAAAGTALDAPECECLVCDFIAHLVSPAKHVTLAASTILLADLPLSVAPVAAFFPARFGDRSSARAPPPAFA